MPVERRRRSGPSTGSPAVPSLERRDLLQTSTPPWAMYRSTCILLADRSAGDPKDRCEQRSSPGGPPRPGRVISHGPTQLSSLLGQRRAPDAVAMIGCECVGQTGPCRLTPPAGVHRLARRGPVRVPRVRPPRLGVAALTGDRACFLERIAQRQPLRRHPWRYRPEVSLESRVRAHVSIASPYEAGTAEARRRGTPLRSLGHVLPPKP
jgi:hypothetical protein